MVFSSTLQSSHYAKFVSILKTNIISIPCEWFSQFSIMLNLMNRKAGKCMLWIWCPSHEVEVENNILEPKFLTLDYIVVSCLSNNKCLENRVFTSIVINISFSSLILKLEGKPAMWTKKFRAFEQKWTSRTFYHNDNHRHFSMRGLENHHKVTSECVSKMVRCVVSHFNRGPKSLVGRFHIRLGSKEV